MRLFRIRQAGEECPLDQWVRSLPCDGLVLVTAGSPCPLFGAPQEPKVPLPLFSAEARVAHARLTVRVHEELVEKVECAVR